MLIDFTQSYLNLEVRKKLFLFQHYFAVCLFAYEATIRTIKNESYIRKSVKVVRITVQHHM